MSDSQRLRVYYTYIDNLGRVQAAIAEINVVGYSNVKTVEMLGRIETEIWQSAVDHDEILIMLVENINALNSRR